MKLLPKEQIKYYPIRFKKEIIWHFDGKKVVVEPLSTYMKRNSVDVRIKSFPGKNNSTFEMIEIWNLPCFTEDDRYPVCYSWDRGNSRLHDIIRGDNGEYETHRRVFQYFVKYVEENDTYEDLVEKLKKAEKEAYIMTENIRNNRQSWPDFDTMELTYEWDRFVTKVKGPYAIRVPENKKKNTFDIMQVELYICSEWPEREQYIKEHMRDMVEIAHDRLENSKTFQRFNVPIGCMTLKTIQERIDSSIVFSFELKDNLQKLLTE